MSSSLDSIPQAVATIVSSCYSSLVANAKGVSNQDEAEKRIINFADKLTRTMVKAMLDSPSGND